MAVLQVLRTRRRLHPRQEDGRFHDIYTRGMARDLAARRITINIVQPGSIDTEMNLADGAYAGFQVAQNALGRYGRPEEIAAGVVFLASPQASFVTGATLNIDGGFTS